MSRKKQNKKKYNIIAKTWNNINFNLLINHGWSFNWWYMLLEQKYKIYFKCRNNKHETKEITITWNAGQIPYEESITYKECKNCGIKIFEDSYDKEKYLTNTTPHQKWIEKWTKKKTS